MPYTIKKVDSNIYVLYAANNIGVLFFHEKLHPFIKSIFIDKSNDYDQNHKLYTKLKEDDFFETPNVDNLLPRPIRTLYFSITYNCNLNCKYCICHQSFAKDKKKLKISKDVANKAIDKFFKLANHNEDKEVVLYGGEPLLFIDTLVHIYEKFREEEKKRSSNKARFILCTNGTLINDKNALFLKKANIYPAVSIDGNKEIHDKYRKYFGLDRGSYDTAVRGYQTLQKHNISSGITLAYGKHNAKDIESILELIVKNFNPKTIALNSMVDFQTGMNQFLLDRYEQSHLLWKAFLKARDLGVYLVKNVMDNRVKPFVERKKRKWICTGCGGRMGVLPEGKIVPCMALSEKYFCEIDKVNSIDDFCPKELQMASPYLLESCKNCIAKATCAGKCPAVNILKNKSIDSRDKDYCYSSLLFLNNLLELLWKETKENAFENIEKDLYYFPTKEDRKRIYKNIIVQDKDIDFQYIPELNTSLV